MATGPRDENDDGAASAASADDALALDKVDEFEFEGRIGGFLSDKSLIYLRFYPDGTLDGHVRQRKKVQLHGLTLLSTSRAKRKRPDEHEHEREPNDKANDAMLRCAFVQGRWLRRGDGHVCTFHAMSRQGHVDRHTLACRAELLLDGTATGTWELSKQQAVTVEEEKDEEDTESESVIENVFNWKRVEKNHLVGDTVDRSSNTKLQIFFDPLAVYPLGPGMYHFRGFTSYHVPDTPHRPQPRTKQRRSKKPPPRDECFVIMELFPDGTLAGKSREVAYPQSCTIRGTWEVGRLRYSLEYKVREAVGLFKYSARVSNGGPSGDGDEAVRVLKGKWRNIDDDQGATPGYAGGRGQFELVCVHRSIAPSACIKLERSIAGASGSLLDEELKAEAPSSDIIGGPMLLRVFTTGSYVLHGKAVDSDGYEYESQLEVELLADGTMHGTCRELVFQQVQRLLGNWTKTAIQYELEYVVKGEVGHYWYQGKLDDVGLVVHGDWSNRDLLLDTTPSAELANARSERGTFSYAILQATRRWSHTSHSDFPKPFRERIRYILLCSQRLHVLPSALWSKIFACCRHDWF